MVWRPLVEETPAVLIHQLAKLASTGPASGWLSWAGGFVLWSADPAARRLVVDGRAIELVAISRHFGGLRWFAICATCGGRRARLHVGAQGLQCRTCYGLVYGSTREDRVARAFRKASKLRARVKADPVPGSLFLRPRRMWRSRFDRLRRAVLVAEFIALDEVRELLDRRETPVA